jgi:hypothetical protein
VHSSRTGKADTGTRAGVCFLMSCDGRGTKAKIPVEQGHDDSGGMWMLIQTTVVARRILGP